MNDTDYELVVKVLKEFVADYEAGSDGPQEWPDLYITYMKAKQVLRICRQVKDDTCPTTLGSDEKS